MSTTTLQTITFKINGVEYLIQLPTSESGVIKQLKEDNEFTFNYIKSLIENNQIQLEDMLNEIKRVENNIEEDVYIKQYEGQCKEIDTKMRNDWGDKETKFLLEKYDIYMSQVAPRKKICRKKHMWAEIASNIETYFNWRVTGLQCDNRYKTILKRKKEAVDNNNKSGSSRLTVPYEEELAKIAMKDDSIQLEVLRNVNNTHYLKPPVTLTSPGSSTLSDVEGLSSSLRDNQIPRKSRRIKSNEELLWELHEKKEAAKERRHKEKVDLIKELLRKE